MKRKTGTLERATLVDVLHLAAILTCTAWTAKLIAEERWGPGVSAISILNGAQADIPSDGVTIPLDEATQTAAR